MTNQSDAYLADLRTFVQQHFSLEDLRTLCLRMNIDFESVLISGETKSPTIHKLLLNLARNNRLQEFLTIAQFERPHLSLPPIPDDFQLPVSLESGNLFNSATQLNINGDLVQGDKISGDHVSGNKYQTRIDNSYVEHIGDKYVMPILVIFFIILILAGIIFLVSREGVEIANDSKRLPVYPVTDLVVAVSKFQVKGNSRIYPSEAIAETFVKEIETIIDQHQENGSRITFVSLDDFNRNVEGDTRKERAQKAEEIAEEINADVIIYGVITWNGWEANIELEFVVSDEYTELGEGEEIAERPEFSVEGPYFPSFNIQVEKGDSQEALDTARFTFSNGFEVLLLISNGLSQYTLGKYEMAQENFEKALEMAQAIPDWKGYDVIFVLLGNAIGQQCADKFYQEHEAAVICFDDAITNFEHAIAENSLYPRSYLGRGSAYYMQGLGDPNTNDYTSTDLDLLDKAIDDYKEALDDKEYLPEANVEEKANLGLGQALLAKTVVELYKNGITPQPEHFSESKERFESVIQKCELEDCASGVDFWLQELTAKSYANLGLIYLYLQEPNKAAEMYEKAIDLLPPFTTGQQRLKQTYEKFLNEIDQEIDERDRAISS